MNFAITEFSEVRISHRILGEAPNFARWHHADGGKRVGKEKLAMSEQENTQLVQQEYTDFQNGDIQSVLGRLSSNVEWVVPQPKGVPLGGTYHGVEEVGRFFSSLGDTQEARQFEPREFVAQGDRVVALGHYAWHVRSTGREWESDFAHVFTVEDGKVRRFQEYTDSAALAEAFGEGSIAE